MVFYRGVAQDQVLESINEALVFLEKHPIGPECQKFVDTLRRPVGTPAVSPLQDIAVAATDEALEKALDAANLFVFVAPVLEFHALNDTDGAGLAVYKKLAAWDAFSGVRMKAYTPLDAEADGYLVCQYMRKLAQRQSMPVVSNFKDTFKCAVALGSGRDGFKAGVMLNSLLKMERDGADDRTILDALEKLNLHERHLVKEAAARLSGYYPHPGRLPKPPGGKPRQNNFPQP